MPDCTHTSNESWLILDTSSRVGLVGVVVNDRVVAEAVLNEQKRHARDLASTVDRLLQESGVSPKSLQGVMVSAGPGSFTGLRVGVTSAKAFAYALGCKLVSVPTFHAIAVRSANEPLLDVIADGLQKNVYVQRFEFGTPVNELKIVTFDEWVNSLPRGITISGPGIDIFDKDIPSEFKRVCKDSQPVNQTNLTKQEIELDPRFADVQSLYLAGKKLSPATQSELFALEPLYLRGSSAEEKLLKHSSG
jgi:tRNA threonylcarbamoyladenosine biosynthesis protein TsaB